MQTRGEPTRGELYWLDWRPARGSEQACRRPALVITADAINRRAPVVVVAAVTSRATQRRYAFHVSVPRSVPTGLTRDSTVLCEQLMTVAKDRLEQRIGSLPPDLMREVDEALKVSLGLS